MKAGMAKRPHSDEPQVPQAKDGKRHPLFGALKDVTFTQPGVDLTEPADPDWGNISEENAVPPARRKP
jgi:hypothetical protein